MLELLAYLRANGFKTFIVSGGGIEFIRPWSERVYGIPPEQVIGSSIKTQFELRDVAPVTGLRIGLLLTRTERSRCNSDEVCRPWAVLVHSMRGYYG